MAIRLYRAPSSRCWPLQADVLTIIKPGGNHSMSAGGVGLPPGVTTTTDGREGAGAGTAGGGLAADGRNLRMCKRHRCLATSLVSRRRCTALRFLPHVAALFSLQRPLPAVTKGLDALPCLPDTRGALQPAASRAMQMQATRAFHTTLSRLVPEFFSSLPKSRRPKPLRGL